MLAARARGVRRRHRKRPELQNPVCAGCSPSCIRGRRMSRPAQCPRVSSHSGSLAWPALGGRSIRITRCRLPLATRRLAGFGESLLEFRIRLNELNAGHVRPRRLRYILALRFASVDFPQQGFQSCVVATLERTLVLRVFGYREPGRTAAATNGVREPLGSYGGAFAAFGPSRSHGFGTGCRRALFLFGFFGGSGGHPPIKNYGNTRAQDYGVHAIPPARRARDPNNGLIQPRVQGQHCALRRPDGWR